MPELRPIVHATPSGRVAVYLGACWQEMPIDKATHMRNLFTTAIAEASGEKEGRTTEADARFGRAMMIAMEAEYTAAKRMRGKRQQEWVTIYSLLRRLKSAAEHLSDASTIAGVSPKPKEVRHG